MYELSDIIGSLSRLFSSTYYVNLEQDTYRAVIQLRRKSVYNGGMLYVSCIPGPCPPARPVRGDGGGDLRVNLEQDTYRAVIQLRRVGDVLGNEVNYTSAIRIYAQYFVHPEDQAEYLQAMDVENLRRELRWWQPCVAVEYRAGGNVVIGS